MGTIYAAVFKFMGDTRCRRFFGTREEAEAEMRRMEGEIEELVRQYDDMEFDEQERRGYFEPNRPDGLFDEVTRAVAEIADKRFGASAARFGLKPSDLDWGGPGRFEFVVVEYQITTAG